MFYIWGVYPRNLILFGEFYDIIYCLIKFRLNLFGRHKVIINRLTELNYNLTIISFDIDLKPDNNTRYYHLEKRESKDKSMKNDILKRNQEGPISSILSHYNFIYQGCRGELLILIE
jgi:hypothetical protein